MEKLEVLRRLEECGVVAVVRGNSEEEVMKIIDACIAGGIIGIEVTFTVPGAADIIKALAKRYDPKDVLIGAGTVLDPETARAAILAGAQFVVSPCLNAETVKMCLRYQIACMPGAMTIKETVDCLEAGADIVKLFPGNLAGPENDQKYQRAAAAGPHHAYRRCECRKCRRMDQGWCRRGRSRRRLDCRCKDRRL